MDDGFEDIVDCESRGNELEVVVIELESHGSGGWLVGLTFVLEINGSIGEYIHCLVIEYWILRERNIYYKGVNAIRSDNRDFEDTIV